jgi:hypothetical protein
MGKNGKKHIFTKPYQEKAKMLNHNEKNIIKIHIFSQQNFVKNHYFIFQRSTIKITFPI